jgi:D-lactate dehydrogenase (cytochrome)
MMGLSNLIVSLEKGSHQEYLRDESRSTGEAESISFPRDEQELRQVVKAVAATGTRITIQGARTGLTGAAVPHGGHVLNTSRMNRIKGLHYDRETGSFFVTVEPGVLLTDLRKALRNMSFDTAGWSEESKRALQQLHSADPHHFTPDPTETSASIGGMINCNASGARSFFYGATRGYVQALRVVLADGSLLCLRRGEHRVTANRFTVTTEDGKKLEGALPDYALPQVKNAAGYYLQPDIDLVDLFVGSEGTLGIISEAELRLLPLPGAIWGVTAFFPNEASALRFVRAVRGEQVARLTETFATRPVAIEYFNHAALDMLRRQRAENAAFSQMQPLAARFHTAIYVEFHGESDQQLRQVVLEMGQLMAACGGDEADSWVASNQPDLEQLQFFRHATPESVNLTIDQRRKANPALTKLGTDMAVPDDRLTEIVALYNRRIADLGLEAVAFGHIGNNHIHVNILPRNLDDYQQGKQLYLEWARQAVAWGGTVSAEHGIGKLKTAFLAEMYGQAGLAKMRQVKRLFDPAGRLNRGNMFEWEDEVSGQ